jgi:hypothetical protein
MRYVPVDVQSAGGSSSASAAAAGAAGAALSEDASDQLFLTANHPTDSIFWIKNAGRAPPDFFITVKCVEEESRATASGATEKRTVFEATLVCPTGSLIETNDSSRPFLGLTLRYLNILGIKNLLDHMGASMTANAAYATSKSRVPRDTPWVRFHY